MATTIEKPQSQEHRIWEALQAKKCDTTNPASYGGALIVRDHDKQLSGNPDYNNRSDDDSFEDYEASDGPIQIHSQGNHAGGSSNQNNGAVVGPGNRPGRLRIRARGNEAHGAVKQNNGFQTITPDVLPAPGNNYFLPVATVLVALFIMLLQMYLKP